jgi:hypothetical protein
MGNSSGETGGDIQGNHFWDENKKSPALRAQGLVEVGGGFEPP